MQKLTKKDRKRFDDVCRRIREALHLEIHRSHYSFCREAADNEIVVGRNHVHDAGDYCAITIYDGFWQLDVHDQLRVLIHEHAHSLLAPLTQWYNSACGQFHPSDRGLLKDSYVLADERVTHHLEAVLYDLLKDRF